ncbi:glycoside hydrolase family 2 protein [Roseomonas sp. CCTCC AB2023176]|uniref:glycoside hydrolase family 2 protein n=1 Tax=Roseomonas sp. CCTCC AB2023176 TaxID=3342640 RepID=UPI0035DA6921
MTVTDPFAHLHDEAYGAPLAARRATAETLFNPYGRAGQSLDGTWRLTLDPFEEGLRQRWWADDDRSSSEWETPRDWEWGAGEPAPVPGCWNLLRPELLHYEGGAWYVRDFETVQVVPGEAALLHFGAAAYRAEVFLNGVHLGGHLGASTPFSLDATSALRPGRNRLMVFVENARRAERVPMHHFDWFNYGGLHRSVVLYRVPALHVRRFALHLGGEPGRPHLVLRAVLSQPLDGAARLVVPALGLDAAVLVRGGVAEAVIQASPPLWSPEEPRLIDVELHFGAEVLRDRIGFRHLATDGTRILLNGRDLVLCGACVHEDDLASGRVTDEADIRRRIADLRALGGNFLRLSHYPHDPRVAQLCDEAGVLLWSEVPVYWAIGFDDPGTLADATNQLREVILRDANRASIILWGVGNENADTDARLAFMAHLAAVARAADPSRLVSAACLINRETFRIEDRLASHLDVIGLNEYFGWYETGTEGLRRLLVNSAPDRPVVISETGADALSGLRGGNAALFTEERQAAFFEAQFAALSEADFVRGIAVWLLYDFRSLRRQARPQGGFNRKGLIAEDKVTRKQSFQAVAEGLTAFRTSRSACP